MNVYRHMVCIDASDVAYATSALTTLYTQAEKIFALKDGKPTYPADKIAHGDVICIDFSDGGKSVSALVYRQNEKDGGIVYASAITDEEGVMLTFDEDGIYKSKQQVAGGGGGGSVTLPINITDPQFAALKSSQSFLNLFSGADGTSIIFYLSEVEEDAPLFGVFGANNNSIMLGRQRNMIALIVQYNEKAYGGLLPDTASYDTPTLAITGQASGIAVEANPASEATESLSKVRIEDKVYSVGGGSAPTNMVTTDTAQTITGVKTFENGLIANKIGNNARGNGIAIGTNANSQVNTGIAIGQNAKTGFLGGIAIGQNASSGNNVGIIIGNYISTPSTNASIAIGTNQSGGENSIGIGPTTYSIGENSIAIGDIAYVSGENSIAIGYQSREQINNAVSFDSVDLSRTLDLYDPTKIFFRNENINPEATSTSAYANGKTLKDYLDEKASLADEQTVSGAWTFTNAAGIAVGAAPDLTTILGTGITHNGVTFSFPTTGGTFATEEKYDPIIPTTLHGDAATNQVTLYHDAIQLSGQTPLQLKTVGGQSLIGSGDIPLATTRSGTSRAIYTHTISIAHSNISYAIKIFTDTDTEITSATALWSALDSSLNAMYIKSENERNIIFDFSKDSSGNITLYYLDASSSMSIEVDTEDLISDNVS